MSDIYARLVDAAHLGMTPSVWAAEKPDVLAIRDPVQTRTFGEVNANANRIARVLRGAGLRMGDGVAVLTSNRAEFVEALFACLRSGFRFTPVNWHLTADEVEYIINDCEAKALIAETRFPAALSAKTPNTLLKLSVGAGAPGFTPLAEAIDGADPTDILDPTLGTSMLYTSGTTGRPKGVFRKGAVLAVPEPGAPDDVQMCVGPAYHAAPLAFDIRIPMAAGVPVVFLDKWDSEGVLATIERHRVTRAHMAPIMFQRLLSLPEAVKARYDLSSLRYIIHGAAPCPPEVKRAMIDWLGPILNEYYAGSEGGAGFVVSSEEWLRKPGTVGRLPVPGAAKLLDDEGEEIVEPDKPGTIYFVVSPISPFEYYKDRAKTAAAHKDGYFTLGDVGYFDSEGYLFLTGRTAECIISGGVNIYPQEIDNEIIKHEAVEDSCVIGVPDDEWGEAVKAVITLNPGHLPSDALAADILGSIRGRLAGFKVPRSLDFVSELPRSPAGKIQRGKVRAPYWAGRARQI